MTPEPDGSATLERALRDLGSARSYNEWLFARARPHLGRRVLDAGAGLGTFTELAANAGAGVVALEPDAAFAERLRRRFAKDPRVVVVEGAAESFSSDADFDSILCLNVLEHVDDDVGALRRFRDALRRDGKVLLLVPAHPSLYGAYDRAAGHMRRYSRASLHSALREAGLEVETLRLVNPLGAAGWFLRVRFRGRGDWPSTSFRTFDRLVPLLRPLDRLRVPFGLSLWAVARPSDE